MPSGRSSRITGRVSSIACDIGVLAVAGSHDRRLARVRGSAYGFHAAGLDVGQPCLIGARPQAPRHARGPAVGVCCMNDGIVDPRLDGCADSRAQLLTQAGHVDSDEGGAVDDERPY